MDVFSSGVVLSVLTSALLRSQVYCIPETETRKAKVFCGQTWTYVLNVKMRQLEALH